MAAENRTVLGTDESMAAALDKAAKRVELLWDDAMVLYRRWVTDPNVRGNAMSEALRAQGVKQQVLKPIDGGTEYKQRLDMTLNTSAGRADQTANFLAAGNAVTQTISYALFPPRLFQGWIGVGFQDRLEIKGNPAGEYDYVAGKVKNNIFALAKQISEELYAYGGVSDAVNAAVVPSMAGLLAAVATSNVVSMDTPADRYYGGINRITAANADWRGNTTTITGSLQPSDLIRLYLACQDANDSPTLGICGATVYGILWNFYEAKQRIMNNNDPTLGKAAPLSFDGMSILLDKTLDSTRLFNDTNSGNFFVSFTAVAATLTELTAWTRRALYMINENYFNLVVWNDSHKNGAPLMRPKLNSTTNLNDVYQAVWCGNLAGSKPKRSGALISITT